MLRRPDKYESPSCATVGGDFWFPELDASRSDVEFAKSICSLCPHKNECAEWGIQFEYHGIWGGLHGLDRRRIRQLRGIRLNQEGKIA